MLAVFNIRNDKELEATMQEFIEEHLDFEPFSKDFQQIRDMLRESKSSTQASEIQITPERLTSQQFLSEQGDREPKIDIFKVSAKKLSRQMALLAYDLFTHLPVRELLDMRWKYQPAECTAIRKLVSYFNMIAGYVPTTILRETNIKQRARLMEKWIEVAECSFKIQDITSTMAIISGLAGAAVNRLKQTHQLLPKSATKTLESLVEVASLAKIKRHLQQITPPAIPYLGVHLTNLSFVADGYSPLLSVSWRSELCVHWYYHRMHAIAIQEMLALLQRHYNFKRDPALLESLCLLSYLGAEDAYQVSRRLEETIPD